MANAEPAQNKADERFRQMEKQCVQAKTFNGEFEGTFSGKHDSSVANERHYETHNVNDRLRVCIRRTWSARCVWHRSVCSDAFFTAPRLRANNVHCSAARRYDYRLVDCISATIKHSSCLSSLQPGLQPEFLAGHKSPRSKVVASRGDLSSEPTVPCQI